jgi:DNA-directed RNA polymerase subunit beta'
MTLSYKKLKTGDIVQGIPKIEHFFEARKTIKGNVNLLQTNLYLKLLILFSKFKRKLSLKRAVKRSLAKIQKIIIDGVCRVYCLQGIIISRKHFEIIVKQMTSKVKVIDGGKTGLLEGEFISLYKIEKINKNLLNKRVIYEPYLLGITKTSLQTESFISSASFQETTKVLTYAALEKRIDFLTGLKENVIIGKLIPSGTGLITTILINY